MTDTVEFGDPILHDGSNKCPEHARDVPCMVLADGVWLGECGDVKGRNWVLGSGVTHYRLPADHPFYAKGEQPAEEPTCGVCRWWARSNIDTEMYADHGQCHFNPPGHHGFPFCLEASMACSKFTAKGAGQ